MKKIRGWAKAHRKEIVGFGTVMLIGVAGCIIIKQHNYIKVLSYLNHENVIRIADLERLCEAKDHVFLETILHDAGYEGSFAAEHLAYLIAIA